MSGMKKDNQQKSYLNKSILCYNITGIFSIEADTNLNQEGEKLWVKNNWCINRNL